MRAEAARDHVSALPDNGTGLDDQRHVRGWICEQPDVLQWIAVQHLGRHVRRRAEFRIRAQVQPPIDTCRPLFMLKPTGFFDHIPALDVPTPGGHCPQKRHECMRRRVDPGKERQIVG